MEPVASAPPHSDAGPCADVGQQHGEFHRREPQSLLALEPDSHQPPSSGSSRRGKLQLAADSTVPAWLSHKSEPTAYAGVIYMSRIPPGMVCVSASSL